jgi:chromosome segregation ATPase
MTALAVVHGEEVEVTATGDVQADGCDCTSAVQTATQRTAADYQALQTKYSQVSGELDEIIVERDRLLEEIEKLRKSLHGARTEHESLRTQLSTEKTAKEEAMQQVYAAKGRIASLEGELEAAYAEIQRLSELSFIVQLRKELETLWGELVDFVKSVVKRG